MVGTSGGRVQIYDLDAPEQPRSLTSPAGIQMIASITYNEADSAVVATDLSGQIVGWSGDQLLIGDVTGGVSSPVGPDGWRVTLCRFRPRLTPLAPTPAR